MAPPAWERGSQGVEKSTPGGPKKEAPGVKFRPPANFAPQGSWKIAWLLGPSLAYLGPVLGRFAPRARGGTRRAFLKAFLGRPGRVWREAKIEHFSNT